jgi:RNA recognition motif-containing protein
MTVYVGNLSYTATEDDLTEVFKEYGDVKRVQLPVDREDAAIEDLDGAEWMGRTLKVNKARPRTERSGRPGGGGGRGGWAGGEGAGRARNFSDRY